MAWTAAPVVTCSLVIAFAGMAKLARPRSTAQALRDAQLPGLRRAGEPVAMAIGAVEIVLAATSIAWGSRATSGLVVLAQLAFAAFALRLLTRRNGAASCGCFGASTAPVHPLHVVVNVALAALAATGVFVAPGTIGSVLGGSAATSVTLVACSALAAWAVVLTFTTLPEVLEAAALVTADGEAS